MKKLLLLCAVLVTALSFSACSGLTGSDGKIYGKYTCDSGDVYGTLGGFPDTMYTDTYYQISAGTYTVSYYIKYNGVYYPGNSLGTGDILPYYVWKSTYTVTVNEGTFLTDGADKYFSLYLSRKYGLQVTGEATVSNGTGTVYSVSGNTQPTGAAPGTSTWTSDDGSITVTTTNTIEKK